jgi:uncharacterized protein
MTLFLLFYLLIYGGVHVYFYFRLQAAFLSPQPLKAAAIFFLIFMVLCPILVRILERFGHEAMACLLSYIGYLWMGIVFLFFAAALVADIYRLCIYAGGFINTGIPGKLMPSPQVLFIIPLVVSLGINIYGYFEAQHIRLEKVVIRTALMPPGMTSLRIVQISDVHVGMIVQGERLAGIARLAQEARPDILVSTGDLVDGQIDSIQRSVHLLRNIKATYGKYAITGNHEFYAGLDQALQFTRDAGFRVLRGEAVDVNGLIRVVGLDDPTGRQMGKPPLSSEKDLLPPGSRSPLFTLLLKHQPHIRTESIGAFDLQLSGHTHKGQIFPFSLITKLFFPLQNGYFDLSGGSALYVSRGTGTWGPPIRFLSPPEITVIDLVNGK